MNYFNLFIAVFLENRDLVIESCPDSTIQQYFRLFFSYKIEDLLRKLNEIPNPLIRTFLNLKCLYYKFDYDKFSDELKKAKDSFSNELQEIFVLLEVECLILKKKIYETSSISSIDDEIFSRIDLLQDSKNDSIKSLAFTFKGDTCCFINQFKVAFRYFVRATEDKKNIRAIIGKGKALYLMEEHQPAAECLKEIVQSFGNVSGERYSSKINFELGFPIEDSVKSLEAVIERDPYYLDVYFDLASFYKLKNNGGSLESLLDKINILFPQVVSHSRFMYFFAVNMTFKKEYEKAEKYFRKLLEINYNDTEINFQLGKAMALSSDPSEESRLKNSVMHLRASSASLRSEIKKKINEGDMGTPLNQAKMRLLDSEAYLGMALSKLKSYEAITILEKVLKESEDIRPIKTMAIALANFGRFSEAIGYLEKGLIRLNDEKESLSTSFKSSYFREYSFCLSQTKNYLLALENVNRAIELSEKTPLPLDLNYLTRGEILFNLEKYDDAEKDLKKYLTMPAKGPEGKKYKELAEMFLELIKFRPKYGDELYSNLVESLLSCDVQMSKINVKKDDLARKIGKKKTIKSSDPDFLMVLRKWNSFTPIISAPSSIGGGYFLKIGDKGYVIDPGFNFIDNFFNQGFSLEDISGIFISHAHNDHTGDLESLFTLFFKHNNDFQDRKIKIDLFFNLGSYKKFCNWIDLKDENYINRISVLSPNVTYQIEENFQLIPISADHNEIISEKYSLSFVFRTLNSTVIFTNDTKFSYDYANEINKHKPDILVVHLGTFADFEYNTPRRDPIEFYKKHLGLLGTFEIINKCDTGIYLISEFGEEFRGLRKRIVDSMRGIFSKKIFPCDVGLTLNLKDRKFKESFTVVDNRPTWDPKAISFLDPDDIETSEIEFQLYYYHKKWRHSAEEMITSLSKRPRPEVA